MIYLREILSFALAFMWVGTVFFLAVLGFVYVIGGMDRASAWSLLAVPAILFISPILVLGGLQLLYKLLDEWLFRALEGRTSDGAGGSPQTDRRHAGQKGGGGPDRP